MRDYYNDEATASQPPPTDQATDKADDSGATALVPRDFLGEGGKQPGDRCEIEVVRVFDDQVEVKYVEHTEDSPVEEPAPAMSAPPSPGATDAYA
jgi:hypothetical protein